MKALFGFLSLIVMIAMVVALIKPKLILFKSEKPSRLAAFGATVIALFVVVGTGMFLTSPSGTSESKTQEIATAPVEPASAGSSEVATAQSAEAAAEPLQVKAGLGISRLEVVEIFQRIGYSFKQGKPSHGEENWIGSNLGAILQILGPEDDATEMSLMTIFSDDEQLNVTLALHMVGFLKLAVPEWQDSATWLTKAMEAKGGETTQAGRLITMNFAQEIGMSTLTVKMDQ